MSDFDGLLDELKIRAVDLELDFPLDEVQGILGVQSFKRWKGSVEVTR